MFASMLIITIITELRTLRVDIKYAHFSLLNPQNLQFLVEINIMAC
jgi:hypothetical protein